jgi:transcriptional regulator with XRE-family HTH domain
MAGVGERIRELREEKGLSQRQLAERCKVARNTIVRTENGTTTPSFELMVRVARELSVDPGELFRTKATALPSTPLTDLSPEELDRRLLGLGSAKEAAKLLDAVRSEELDLEQFLITQLNPKLTRSRIYRAAILDRWTNLADPRGQPFRGTREIANEVADSQEWMRDLFAAKQEASAHQKAG